MATKKYLSLERLSEYDGLIKAEIAEGDASVKSYVNTELAKKANSSHTHDDRYYTESEIDSKLSGKSDTGHKHEISDINELRDILNNKAVANHKHSFDDIIEGTLSIAKGGTGATTEANARTNLDVYSKSEVDTKFNGLDYYKTFYFQNATSTYAGAPSDGSGDTTGFEAEGKDAICFVASDGRIDFSLEPNSYGADEVIITVNADPEGSADAALEEAKDYTDEKIANLLDNSTEAVDSIMELADAMKDNADAIEALEGIAAGKANTTHSHAIPDVTGLQDALDGKAAASHGTHVTWSTTSPKMNGTASVGSETKVARGDHVHPTDTSRASKTEFDTHVADTTKHITSTERTNWGTAYTHSQAAHAPSNAEKNQNAFSNVAVSGQTTVAADTATDTLTLVAGDNVTITTNANSDSITIAAKDTVYTHPTSGVTAGTYRSVTVNAQGHVTAGTNPTTLAGYGITDAASKTHTHAISDITNLQTTLNNAANAISTNTQSIDAHTTRISSLETKVGDGFEEITSAEIQALFNK